MSEPSTRVAFRFYLKAIRGRKSENRLEDALTHLGDVERLDQEVREYFEKVRRLRAGNEARDDSTGSLGGGTGGGLLMASKAPVGWALPTSLSAGRVGGAYPRRLIMFCHPVSKNIIDKHRIRMPWK